MVDRVWDRRSAPGRALSTIVLGQFLITPGLSVRALVTSTSGRVERPRADAVVVGSVAGGLFPSYLPWRRVVATLVWMGRTCQMAAPPPKAQARSRRIPTRQPLPIVPDGVD